MLSNDELESRVEVKVEQYFISVNIEGETAAQMARTIILPAAVRYLNTLTSALAGISELGTTMDGLAGEAKKLSETIDELTKKLAKLDKRNAELGGDEVRSKALHVHDSVVPAMDAVRVICDMLERMIPSDLWPLPTYQEMLFVK